MNVDEIYDGNAVDDKEKKFWARQKLIENGDPVQILAMHLTLLKSKKS